jgi:hypothetical protein
MASVTVPRRTIPVLTEADVLVCGGGPAGITAAVAAARHGARVVLVERWPSVGGQATNALVNIWHTSDRTKQVIFGLVQELVERGGRHVTRRPDYPARPETHDFDPTLMRVVFHDLLDSAGVRTLCHLPVSEPLVADGRLRGVLVATKHGPRALLASIVVDATGDADVASAAGVTCDIGRPGDGRVQGMTMMFRLRGIDSAAARAHPADAERVLALMQELRAEGRFPPFMDLAAAHYLRSGPGPDVSFNMCPVAGNPLDEEELTRLSVTARRQVVAYLDLWRREMPGFQGAEIDQMGFWLGVRESRRIRGRQTLDAAMVAGATKQPDAIGHGFWLIDIHDPLGSGYTTWADQDQRLMPPVGASYHLPLGICLTDQAPNLAVAGRCASMTHEGLASARIQTHCMVMGQGVGTAAALALDAGVDLAQVDIARLQATLRRDGVYLEDVPEG